MSGLNREIVLEERTCENGGCGKKFKVMAGSSQKTCGNQCSHNSNPQKISFVGHSRVISDINIKKTLPQSEVDFRDHLKSKPVVSKERGSSKADLDRWQSYVDRAKKIYKQINANRMEIAQIAIEACDINHGGGSHWSDFEGVYTIRKFAEDVGVSYKTLHNWVSVKTLIKDQVGLEWDDDKWSAAVRTRNKVNKKTPRERVSEVYRKEKARQGPGITFATMIKRLSQARHYLVHRIDLEQIDEEDLKKMVSVCSDLLAFIKVKRGIMAKDGTTSRKLNKAASKEGRAQKRAQLI